MGRSFRRNSLWQNGLKMTRNFADSIVTINPSTSAAQLITSVTTDAGSLSWDGSPAIKFGLDEGNYVFNDQAFNITYDEAGTMSVKSLSFSPLDAKVLNAGDFVKTDYAGKGSTEIFQIGKTTDGSLTFTEVKNGTTVTTATANQPGIFQKAMKSAEITDLKDLKDSEKFMKFQSEYQALGGNVKDGADALESWSKARTAAANADVAELQTTKFWMDFGMNAFKGIAELTTNILQYKLAQQKMDNDGRLITLKEQIAEFSNTLQTKLMDKEYAFKDAVLKNQKEIAELSTGADIQKARIAADVRKAGDRNRSMAQIFARRNYGYGQPRYA